MTWTRAWSLLVGEEKERRDIRPPGISFDRRSAPRARTRDTCRVSPAGALGTFGTGTATAPARARGRGKGVWWWGFEFSGMGAVV
eukprot:29189-Pelagococcus_subviridis.AAC.5